MPKLRDLSSVSLARGLPMSMDRLALFHRVLQAQGIPRPLVQFVPHDPADAEMARLLSEICRYIEGQDYDIRTLTLEDVYPPEPAYDVSIEPGPPIAAGFAIIPRLRHG